MASHFHLKIGQANHPTTGESNPSTIPHPLFGDGPIMPVNRSEAASESSHIMNSPLSTAAMIWEPTFSEDGNLACSSDMGLSTPCMRFVSGVLVFCSNMNPGETKSAGKAQWIEYVDCGQLYRRTSIRRVSAKARTAHLAALRDNISSSAWVICTIIMRNLRV